MFLGMETVISKLVEWLTFTRIDLKKKLDGQ